MINSVFYDNKYIRAITINIIIFISLTLITLLFQITSIYFLCIGIFIYIINLVVFLIGNKKLKKSQMPQNSQNMTQ